VAVARRATTVIIKLGFQSRSDLEAWGEGEAADERWVGHRRMGMRSCERVGEGREGKEWVFIVRRTKRRKKERGSHEVLILWPKVLKKTQ
jgi:hypothetical protein